jgi:hypothetical protein
MCLEEEFNLLIVLKNNSSHWIVRWLQLCQHHCNHRGRRTVQALEPLLIRAIAGSSLPLSIIMDKSKSFMKYFSSCLDQHPCSWQSRRRDGEQVLRLQSIVANIMVNN